MTQEVRPVGPTLAGWEAPPAPGPAVLEGRYARLERLAERHAGGLWEAFAEDAAGAIWTYMPHGPFADEAAFAAWVAAAGAMSDPFYYAITDRGGGRTAGVAAFLAIRPAHGVIELGAITFAPCLQRTRAATEAITLMGSWAFGAGYRRFEWKCDALNAASRRAAERLGFRHEGTFRRHMVVKGRSRDTAWYAIIDAEWPRVRERWEAWLDPENFDAEGRQRRRLAAGGHGGA
jgi:RimJ/RimL family protein N-acetyltransferase